LGELSAAVLARSDDALAKLTDHETIQNKSQGKAKVKWQLGIGKKKHQRGIRLRTKMKEQDSTEKKGEKGCKTITTTLPKMTVSSGIHPRKSPAMTDQREATSATHS
jgi:hypothetical protein